MTDSSLRFLNEHKDMPFLMVQAVGNFFNKTKITKDRVLPSSTYDPSRTEVKGDSSAVEDFSEYLALQHDADRLLGANRGLVGRHLSVEQAPLKPQQALCLTVSLANASFIAQPGSRSKKPVILDVKIDVFFNGILCASTFVSERDRKKDEYRTELAQDQIEIIQRFTGR